MFMKGKDMNRNLWIITLLTIAMVGAGIAQADVFVQAPPDTDGVDTDGDGIVNNDYVSYHFGAGDGFARMADGKDVYTFGFMNLTGINDQSAMMVGTLAANLPGPTLSLREGQQVYLTLTNVGMFMRPDLFDAHTLHFHGFPNASIVFDGEPMASFGINMGSSLTYFYNIVEPGTFMYHCHVEATEHMQMGMLSNLYVLPRQNLLANGADLDGFTHQTGFKYAYNDGDGSTYYDVDYPIQITGIDPAFHEADLTFQPLPFAEMVDTYSLINGRGYPDTINPAVINNMNGYPSQPISSRIVAEQGQKVLLRLSNLSTTDHHAVSVLGIPMNVVGRDARLLRSPGGQNTSYTTSSIDLGGGEAADVILDTTGVEPGTYHLYTTNMQFLSNDAEDFGGIMTEIVIVGAGGAGESLAVVSPNGGGLLSLNAPPTFTWNYTGIRDLQFIIQIAANEQDLGTVNGIALPAGGTVGNSYTLTDTELASLVAYLTQNNTGSFYWRVLAFDGGGPQLVSNAFLVGTRMGDLELISPINDATVSLYNGPPRFTFVYDGTQLDRFRLQFSATPDFARLVNASLVRSDGSYVISPAQWTRIRKLFARQPDPSQWKVYWRVKGALLRPRTIAYSETQRFMIDGGTITLTSPAFGTVASRSGLPPRLTWEDSVAAWPRLGGRGKYYVQISKSPLFTARETWTSSLVGTPVQNLTVPLRNWRKIATYLRIPTATLNAGPVPIYWRVIGRDQQRVLKVYSDVRTLQLTN